MTIKIETAITLQKHKIEILIRESKTLNIYELEGVIQKIVDDYIDMVEF